MRIVLPGGTGQVGGILGRAFHEEGHEVVVLSRRPASAPGRVVPRAPGRVVPHAPWRVVRHAPWRVVPWDARTVGPWARELEGADVVCNLAGRSVDCRYTASNRRQMMDSRVLSTRAVGAAIAQAANPPRVWLQASTATIYAHRHDAANDEATGRIGGSESDAPALWGFSIEIAQAWERAALEADTPATRKVLLRSAMTMSPDRGGIFDALLRLVRLGLGGPVGGGRQYVSWIHDGDFVRAVRWLIDHDELSGAVNVAAPNPLAYTDFMRALRAAQGVRIGLPATRWMLEIGAFCLRTESELVLKSRRVVPGRLLDSGFAFEHPAWPEAARDLCERWRAGRHGAPAGRET